MKKVLTFTLFVFALTLKSQSQIGLNAQQLNGYFEDLAVASRHPEKVKHLNLMYQDLTTIPDVVFKFKNLEVLDISNNKIEELSERLIELPKLSKLFVNSNNIKTLPSNFANLRLHTLYIQKNPVNSLPHFSTLIPTSIVKLEAGNPPAGHTESKGIRHIN